MAELLELYLVFIKIGFTSFGGMSMIPLILQEMVSHQWMTTEDMSNLIAIAEMTPGPLGLNCATFAGTRTAGPLGGAVAVFGVLTPAFTAALLIAVFYQKMKNSQVMETILSVIRPICVGMLMEIVWNLTGENYICETGIDWKACMIGVMAAYLLIKRKWEVPGIIAVAAISGIAIWYML